MRLLSTLCGLCALLAVGGPRPAASAIVPAVAYDVTDLGTFAPVDVNSRGQILGLIKPDGDRAGLWTQGRVTLLPLPRGWKDSTPAALNDAGQAVGIVSGKGDNGQAVLWKNGRAVLLSRRESRAEDINTAGQVVGSVGDRAVVWQGGRARDLGGPPTAAALINDRGDIIVAGYGDEGPAGPWDGTFRADRRGGRYVLREISDRVPDSVLQPGVSGGGHSEFSVFPYALNDRGEIAGGNRGHGDFFHRAFLWRPDPARPHAATSGTVRRLPTPGEVDAEVSGLNNQSQAVGFFQAANIAHACLWRDGQCSDLTALIPRTSG